MKKLLLLICVLLGLGTSGAWADATPNILALPQPGKIYYIAGSYNNGATKAYLYYDSSVSALRSTSASFTSGDFAYLWLCTFDGTSYQFQNLSTKTYLGFDAMSASAVNFALAKDVTDANCVALVYKNGSGGDVYMACDHQHSATSPQALNHFTGSKGYTAQWTSDYRLEEYAAQTLCHNQYYYIYCDNDDSGTSSAGTDIRQYLFNNSGSLNIQKNEASVSLSNYAWRAQQISSDHFSFKNGTKYLAFHTLSDEVFDWNTNYVDVRNEVTRGIGRVCLWGTKPSKGDRYMLINYNDDGSTISTGGFSDRITSSVAKSSSQWSFDYIFRIAPQTNVYRVAIKVEAPSYANPVFTFDGQDYSGDCSIYVDGNNLPGTKAISVKSSDVSFDGFYLEDGTSLGTTLDVSALAADKGVIAKFYPFKISASYADATWYHMSVGGKWAYYDGSKYSLTADEFDDAVTAADNSCWAFIANGAGFNIINHGVGSGHYLTSSNSPSQFVTEASGFSIWTYKEQEGGFSFDNGGYYMISTNKYQDTDGNYALGYNNGYISSALTILTPVDWKDIASARLTAFAEEQNMGAYFGVLETSITATQGYLDDGTISVTSASTYEAFKTYLTGTVALSVKYPGNGNYRIKNNQSGNYMAWGKTSKNTDGALITIDAENKDADLSTIFHLEKVSNTQYKISTQGGYVQTKDAANTQIEIGSSSVTYNVEIATPGIIWLQHDSNKFSSGGGTTTGHLAQSSTWVDDPYYDYTSEGVISWNSGSEYSKWVVEDATSATIPLTAANDNTSAAHTYATLCVPFNITGLTGASSKEVKAYAPTKDGDYIVPGSGATTVTEGTPVLLIGAEGATSVTATIGSNYATTPATTNVLTGTFTGASINCASGSNNYVLGFDSENDNRIGFYHVSGGSSFALKANRAYLNTSAGVKGFAISFGDIIDSIKAMDNTPVVHDGPIFNLAGQRMNKLQRGVNIVNGKKFIVK